MRYIREEKALSRRELGEKLGITPGALWKIEAGKTVPKPQTIQRFLEATEVSRAEILLRSIDYDDIPAQDFLQGDIKDILATAINILYRHRRYE